LREEKGQKDKQRSTKHTDKTTEKVQKDKQRSTKHTYKTKKKVQKDKQRSTKHTHKTKDRVTRTPLNIGGELRCSGRVGRSYSTSGNPRVNLVTNPVIIYTITVT